MADSPPAEDLIARELGISADTRPGHRGLRLRIRARDGRRSDPDPPRLQTRKRGRRPPYPMVGQPTIAVHVSLNSSLKVYI